MADKYINTNLDVAGIENLTKFDSFFVNRYVDGFVTGYSFVFVTKPSLFIYPYKPNSDNNLLKLAHENMTKDQFFSQFIAGESLNQNDRTIVEQLSFFEGLFPSTFNNQNFLPIFTNKARSFSALDVVLEQQEAFQTRRGYRMPLPTSKIASEAAGSLSIPMFETPNLDIIKMLNIWVNYISNVTDGTFHANPRMIKNGIIDYMSSVFYFVLEPDGKTLKYWSKYTGCWPTTVPFSQLSFRKGDPGIVEVEANFVYTSKEDMNIAILEDFNRISLNVKTMRREETAEDYLSVKKSQYLDRDNIINNPNFSADTRGPMVFYANNKAVKSTNSGPLNDKFELTFPTVVYNDTFVKNKFNEDYFFKTEQFFKSKLDEEE